MSKVTCAVSVGGQALIEGVMMKSPTRIATAVRKQNGEMVTRVTDLPQTKKGFKSLPFIRGVFNFFSMMKMGYSELMYSADIATEEEKKEEPSKFEKWLAKVFHKDVMDIVMVLAVLLGVGLALGLFVLVPTLLGAFIPDNTWRTVFESVLKVAIFIGYMVLTSLLPDMKRVFQYHGAEHKTIACFEAGDELTPANAKKHCRFHPRCGTNFITITVLLSIVVFLAVSPLLSALALQNTFIRIGIKLLLLPIIVSISYEIIRIAGKFDNLFTKIVCFPGMMMQRITTKEPDESQLECAITAFNLALNGEDK